MYAVGDAAFAPADMIHRFAYRSNSTRGSNASLIPPRLDQNEAIGIELRTIPVRVSIVTLLLSTAIRWFGATVPCVSGGVTDPLSAPAGKSALRTRWRRCELYASASLMPASSPGS